MNKSSSRADKKRAARHNKQTPSNLRAGAKNQDGYVWIRIAPPGEAAEEQKLDTCVTLNGSEIQLAVGPQPLRLRNHNSGLAHRIMVKRLETSPHDPLGITDSACKNQLVVVSVQYGPFNPYIPIRSTTIGKSRVAIDPIAMRTSWRSNSDIASVTRYKQIELEVSKGCGSADEKKLKRGAEAEQLESESEEQPAGKAPVEEPDLDRPAKTNKAV
ncbi:cleavage stimulation factor subunit 2-like [Dorcoceras hygrometricum]|uniref:Cleavage stimulation factor subunit 2-like n=1 Tax=Dorcoceras hygrometricum TaxID=472368 RepID=A0A2Z7CCV4_9LAMI|nr:cleavage stimulation factor subunit 2-like [Dorcoceras hygrometricum]